MTITKEEYWSVIKEKYKLSTELIELKAKFRHIKEINTNLKLKLDEKSLKITELELTVTNTQKLIVNNNSINNNNKTIEKNNNRKTYFNENIELKNKIKILEDDAHITDYRIRQLSSSVKRYMKQLKNKDLTHQEETNQLNKKYKIELDHLKQELHQHRQQLEDLSKNDYNLHETLAKYKAKMKQFYSNQFDTNSDQITKFKRLNDDLTYQITLKEKKINELNETIIIKDNDINDLKDKLNLIQNNNLVSKNNTTALKLKLASILEQYKKFKK